MAAEITKNHDIIFCNRPKSRAADIFFYGCKDVGFAPYSEYWRQGRKVCVLELLSLRRVLSFEFVREEETGELVRKLRYASARGNMVNLSELLIATSNNIVARCILGRRFQGDDGKSKFGELIRRKDGMLQMELTLDNLKAILLDMFVAGRDTTSPIVEWGMAELLKNETTMKKAQEDIRKVIGKKSIINVNNKSKMEYLKCVIKKTLRLHPLVALIYRETSERVKLGGYDIPPKVMVLINSWAFHRNPSLWDRLKELVPEKFGKKSN
nr:cytochrome P450 71A1-like [Ziziphus jujuba var. spinosa]